MNHNATTTERLQRGRVVRTKCALLDFSLDFSLSDNHNKDFLKDSALVEIESNTLPKVIRTAKRND
jgi:hypothetical protein